MTQPIDLNPVLAGAQLRTVAEEPTYRTITLTVQARNGQGYRLRLAEAHIARRSPRFGLVRLPHQGQIAWWLVARNQLLLVLEGGHFLTIQAEVLELVQLEEELCECLVR